MALVLCVVFVDNILNFLDRLAFNQPFGEAHLVLFDHTHENIFVALDELIRVEVDLLEVEDHELLDALLPQFFHFEMVRNREHQENAINLEVIQKVLKQCLLQFGNLEKLQGSQDWNNLLVPGVVVFDAIETADNFLENHALI